MYLVKCRKKIVIFVLWLLELYTLSASSLPGPRVYVVTPATRSLQIDEGRSAPFYYHNWMRRMDSPGNTTATTSTTTPKVKTPDLIFAEFESENSDDNMRKSIRKLLQREHVVSTTTMKPSISQKINTNELKEQMNKGVQEANSSAMADYYAMLQNIYNSSPPPVYLPSTTPATTTSTTTTSTTPPMDVKNIWHIIDSEKVNQYAGKWEEVPIDSNEKDNNDDQADKTSDGNDAVDENFALPGFNTSPEKAGENESRAIRTEPNLRFPYVNLKTFQLKNNKNPLLTYKKGPNNNIYTNLDNFREVNYPVRGEAQDVVPTQPPIERYNPAQPYLPSEYGGKSKQSMKTPSGPVKTIANLVPPPPPPAPPQANPNDFPPPPTNYESFPPYVQSFPAPRPSPPVSSPVQPPNAMLPPPVSDDDSDSGPPPGYTDADVAPPSNPGYSYNAPPPPMKFLPTLPPPVLSKPFTGYTYEKPMQNESPGPSMDMDDKPPFSGYHYKKPSPPDDSMPPSDHSYHHGAHSYNAPESSDDDEYPELIYGKPHGGMDDSKGGNDMKGAEMGATDMGGSDMGGSDMGGSDMGMPPPPPPDMDSMKPDHSFPHDFPGDFKYHDDSDDFYHGHHYHHHHTTTTTTTTTEMPRVNRYSYYYLGKKLYYLPLYFSVYFIIYVGALIIKAVLRHKIVYPNSWRPNDMTASFFSKRSTDDFSSELSSEKLREMTRVVTNALANAAEKYMNRKND